MENELSLILVPAPDESLYSPDYQKELGVFLQSLREQGVQASFRARTQDAIGSSGVQLGEYGMMVAAFGSICKLIGVWIQARCGRKARVKVGPIEVEAETKEDVDSLLTRAEDTYRRIKPQEDS